MTFKSYLNEKKTKIEKPIKYCMENIILSRARKRIFFMYDRIIGIYCYSFQGVFFLLDHIIIIISIFILFVYSALKQNVFIIVIILYLFFFIPDDRC